MIHVLKFNMVQVTANISVDRAFGTKVLRVIPFCGKFCYTRELIGKLSDYLSKATDGNYGGEYRFNALQTNVYLRV